MKIDNDNIQLRQTIWKIIRLLDWYRWYIESSMIREYILVLIFYKYLNDNCNEIWSKLSNILKIPRWSSFEYLYNNKNEKDLWNIINNALKDFEFENRNVFINDDWIALFDSINFNNKNFWDKDNRNHFYSDLLSLLYKLDFSNTELSKYSKGFIKDLFHFITYSYGSAWEDFYTPKELVMLLSELLKTDKVSKIYDPFNWIWNLLMWLWKEIWSNKVILYGQEINRTQWMISVMNLFINWYENALFSLWNTIFEPKFTDWNNLMKFDIVVSNIPFWMNLENVEKLRKDKYWRFWRWLPTKVRADWTCLTHIVESIKEETWIAGVIVPDYVLYRWVTEWNIRKTMVEENIIEAVISLPSNLFSWTSLATSIIIFNKGKKDDKILFIDASKYFEKQVKINKLTNIGIKIIVDIYNDFKSWNLKDVICNKYFSYIAEIDEVREKNFDLNIQLYVNNYEEENIITLDEITDDIILLDIEYIKSEEIVKERLIDLWIKK
jgi:type I restriction enzyme M protein